MSEFTLRIENMHCGSCIRRVSQALGSAGGLQVKEIRVGAARVASSTRVSSSEGPAPIDLAIGALAKAGYPAFLEQ